MKEGVIMSRDVDIRLHAAIKENNITQFSSLLDSGANVNAVDNKVRTPLHYVIKNARKTGSQDFRFFNALVKSGANLEMQDSKGRTPLLYSLNTGERGAIFTVALMQSGANVNAVDNEGKNALSYAIDSMNMDNIFNLSCRIDNQLLIDSMNYFKKLIKELDQDQDITNQEKQESLVILNNVTNVLMYAKDGQFAHAAVAAGNIKAVKQYINSNPDYIKENANEIFDIIADKMNLLEDIDNLRDGMQKLEASSNDISQYEEITNIYEALKPCFKEALEAQGSHASKIMEEKNRGNSPARGA